MIAETKLMVKTIGLFLLLVNFGAAFATAQQPSSYNLVSPNGRIQIRIQTGDRLTYDVVINNKTVLHNCSLSIDIDHKTLGLNPRIKSEKPIAIDHEIEAAVPLKSAKVRETY